jgi:TIR domain
VGARIFISHSCKDQKADPDEALCYARKVRRRIVDKLGKNHTVWLDVESLVPGDRWRVRLHEWLGTCDGAVILLDRTSVASAWLRKEATILGWRASFRERVRVVPVFLGDFTTGDLQCYDYGPLDLDDSQAARLKSTELSDANAEALARLVATSFADLAPTHPNSAMARWIGRVAELIASAHSPLAIEWAAESLDVEEADLAYFQDHSVAVARQLLHVGLERSLKALDILADGMNKEKFAALAALCFPTWVDTDAGADLNALLEQDPRPLVAINSDDVQIGKDYVGRASCAGVPDRRFVTVSDAVGEGDTDELLPRYEEAMRQQLGTRPGKPKLLRAALERAELEKYVLVSGDAVHPNAVAALQARYKKATFLLLPGLENRSDFMQQLRVVKPELDEDQLDAVDGLRNELGRMVTG